MSGFVHVCISPQVSRSSVFGVWALFDEFVVRNRVEGYDHPVRLRDDRLVPDVVGP